MQDSDSDKRIFEGHASSSDMGFADIDQAVAYWKERVTCTKSRLQCHAYEFVHTPDETAIRAGDLVRHRGTQEWGEVVAVHSWHVGATEIVVIAGNEVRCWATYHVNMWVKAQDIGSAMVQQGPVRKS